MELIGQSVLRQEMVDRVDPVGHDQRRPFGLLGEKEPQRPVERARHPHMESVAGDQGERSVDRPDGFRVAAQYSGPGLVDRHVIDSVDRGIGEVEQLSPVLDLLHGF
jgi:hypothetical protein